MPEAVHTPERRGVLGQEIRPVGKYWEDEAIGDAMAHKGADTRPRGGQALDGGEDSLGQGEPISEVVGGGGEGGGKPVP